MSSIAEKTNGVAEKAAHTPTPWKLNGTAIVPEHGAFISAVDTTVPHIGYLAHNNPFSAVDEERAANGAFIIRACNAHDALLSAAKEARKLLGYQSGSNPEYEKVWRQVTDAIALAEGPMRPKQKRDVMPKAIADAISDILFHEWADKEPTPRCFDFSEERAGQLITFIEGNGDLESDTEVRQHLHECARCRFIYSATEKPLRRPKTIHHPQESQNPGAVSDMSGPTTNAAENAQEGDSTLSAGCSSTESERQKFDRSDRDARPGSTPGAGLEV